MQNARGASERERESERGVRQETSWIAISRSHDGSMSVLVQPPLTSVATTPAGARASEAVHNVSHALREARGLSSQSRAALSPVGELLGTRMQLAC